MSESQLQELAAAGLTPDDVAAEPVEIWPDNLQAYMLFDYMQTQWRMGPSGPCGLDYRVMHSRMTRMKLTDEAFDQLEDDLRAMESAALNCIYGTG